MSDAVWISTAPGHASNMRPLRNDISENDPERFEIARKKIKAGEPILPEEFPKIIFGAPHAHEKDYNFPDLFTGYGYWVVSGPAAEVLRRFDLGGGALYPVKVFKKDRVTPVEGEFSCINFGNRKEAFLPEQSTSFREMYIRDGKKGWFAKATLKDDDFVVSRRALDGSDLWIDYNVGDSFFVSDQLRSALKKVKCDKGFFLKKCRVI